MNEVIINDTPVNFSIESERIFINSLELSKVFNKRHDHILRAIEKLPNDSFNKINFELSSYKDLTGRTLPAYHLTRDGFCLLVMGFTGEKAYKWKIEYIKAFNLMESKLRQEQVSSYVSQLADCQAFIIKERKHQKDQINGYKSQIAQHNAVIASQRTQLATLQAKCEALEVEVIEAKEHSNESLLKYTRQERDHYRKRCNELLAQKNEFSHYLKNVKEFNARLECLIDGFLNEAIYAQIKNQSVVSEIKKHFFANFRGNAPHICYGLAYGTEIN